jgi:hypothetical protein
VQVQLFDRLTIDATTARKTADGYLVANARAARTGVQLYRAKDLGLTDGDPNRVIKVYRPPEEVFHADAMASLAFKPLTNDHPAEPVTAENWKDHATGHAGGDIVRDGQFVRVPLLMMDAAAIRDLESGKRQLSVGYTCDLVMDGGTVPEGVTNAGETFDAYQTNIRANHIAQCDQARGGAALVFGDALPDAPPTLQQDGVSTVTTKTIVIDGFSVIVDANAENLISRLQGQVAAATAAKDAAETALGAAQAAVATKDGEIAGLTSKLADATNPATLAAAAAARASVITSAKSLLGDAYTGDGVADADIRRAAVAVKLPDAADATKMTDAAVEGAFRMLTAGVVSTDTKAPVHDGIAKVVLGGGAALADAGDPKALRDAAFAARADGKAQAYLGAKSDA